MEIRSNVIGFKIVNPSEIVDFLEFGTRPHVILPRFASVLRFEIGGEVIFSARVYHPGTKPLCFVRRTQEEIDRKGEEILKAFFNRINGFWH